MSTSFCGVGYRITFLTSRLVRLEWQDDGLFEDLPTTCARFRDFPPVAVVKHIGAHGIELDTEHLHLVYDEKPFSASGLSISVKGGVSLYHSVWRYGEAFSTLGGTARTLDMADGAIALEPGLMSVNGFSVLDDSRSMVYGAQGVCKPRHTPETDLYFFGYGHDYASCLQDFYRLSGPTPLLPRFALGNWWSRYHEYTEESYLRLMDRFDEAQIPLSVAVIDMDWHLTDVPNGSGWTGYTWNRKLFPDPTRFLEALHSRGLYVTLNLHPAGGVEPHEEAYECMCRALDRDPKEGRCIDFDASDERFLRAYLDCLHHPLEKQGVDFWWIDWQQGSVSAVEGLDPLWVLNERHYLDNERNGRRGLILSRYAGPGSHRYPVGFSGDTVASWKSLAFQPAFTATAANIGYPWWSHDIGGHMHGVRDDELAVRWLQFGVFSPILRLHSGKNAFAGKEPWSYGVEAEGIMTRWLRMRHRLIPYLYTAAERAHRLGEPPVRPLYHRWPDSFEAYRAPHQYLFGPSLMVCAITQPMDSALRLSKATAWLPQGLWYDWMTGQPYDGDRMLCLWRTLEDYPVLAPAGALIPLADDLRPNENPVSMTLRVFAGASGSFTLYEDDGLSLISASARTRLELNWEEGALSLSVEGDAAVLPKERVWHVECIGFAPTEASCNGSALPSRYDETRNALCFTLSTEPSLPVTVRFDQAALARDNWLSRVRERLQRTQTSTDEKERIWRLLSKKGRTPAAMGALRVMCETPGLADCLEELLFANGGER